MFHKTDINQVKKARNRVLWKLSNESEIRKYLVIKKQYLSVIYNYTE